MNRFSIHWYGLLAIAVIIFGPLSTSFSQEAMPDANLIIITTPDKPDAALKNIGRIFVASDYEIESSDANLGLITTKPTKKGYGFLGAGSLIVKLTAQIDECDSSTCISLTGKFDENMKIENAGMNGSPKKSSWNFMDGIAKKYKGGKITYEVVHDKD